MNRMTAWMLFAGLAITSVGCTASGTALTRGQSPEHGCPTGECQHGGGMAMHDAGMMPGGMMHGGMMHGGMPQGMMCPDGCWHGPYNGMGGMGPGQYQGHTIHYTHEMPKNLRYPNPNVPPTVVQYPYYTVKGPSDFFMK